MTETTNDIDGLLTLYLRDHHAAAAAGVELAGRLARENERWQHGPELAALAAEIEADRTALGEVLLALGTGPSPLKIVVATTIERVSRLKLNGRLTGYSPLSRVVELETLCAGVVGKRALWRSLTVAQTTRPQLGPYDFGALEARANDQLDRLETIHADAVAAAFEEPVTSAAA